MKEKEFKILLSIAEQTAILAGNFLKKQRNQVNVVTSSIGKDIKILADSKTEEIIIKNLQRKTAIPILGEERGMIKKSASINEPCWVVDPLDGTVNYHRGIPISNVSIGLYHRDEFILGVIYDFNRDELFRGIVGIGAWINDLPIKVSSIAKINEAVICTGFPVSMNLSKENIGSFVSKVQRYKKIRMIGSAALSLAYVASGRVDVYYENNIKLWDVAAGIALVKAAGGIVRQGTKNKKDNVLEYVLASNKLLSGRIEI